MEAKDAAYQELDKMLEQVRAALADRKVDEAKKSVDAAEEDAVGEALKKKLEAARLLLQGVENFWEAVREGSTDLRAGDTIEMGTTVVAIVENSPDKLIIRTAGRNQTYAWNALPSGLARQFAKSWFDSAAPSSKFAVGAFLLVDPIGDKDEARTLWQQAARAGLEIEHLMPLVD